MQVSIVSIAVNAVLTLFKLFVGIAAQSGAMVSDAVHSASDVFSTLIVIAGVTVAEKRPDSGHPYGHERMECVASLLLAVILAATGIGIGAAGMKRIAEGGSLSVPGMAALLAAVISIAVKEWMFRFTKTRRRQDQIRCAHGGCLASPLGRPFVCGRICRDSGRQAGLSCS